MSRSRAPLLLAAALALVAVAGRRPCAAQADTALADSAAPVPFGPGERAVYRVTYGLFGTVGEAVLEVAGVDTLRGRAAYRLHFTLSGGIPFAHVADDEASWLDVAGLYALRFFEDKKEAGYRRRRTLDFLPDQGIYRWLGEERTDSLAAPEPLDDISFVYWARTLALPPGASYVVNRYFARSGNPVTIRVVRRDSVRVPAGAFATVVLEPSIRTRGLFSEGGKAELHLSDDARRIPVFMKVKLSVGTLKLHLKAYQPGTPLSPRPFAGRVPQG